MLTVAPKCVSRTCGPSRDLPELTRGLAVAIKVSQRLTRNTEIGAWRVVLRSDAEPFVQTDNRRSPFRSSARPGVATVSPAELLHKNGEAQWYPLLPPASDKASAAGPSAEDAAAPAPKPEVKLLISSTTLHVHPQAAYENLLEVRGAGRWALATAGRVLTPRTRVWHVCMSRAPRRRCRARPPCSTSSPSTPTTWRAWPTYARPARALSVTAVAKAHRGKRGLRLGEGNERPQNLLRINEANGTALEWLMDLVSHEVMSSGTTRSASPCSVKAARA